MANAPSEFSNAHYFQLTEACVLTKQTGAFSCTLNLSDSAFYDGAYSNSEFILGLNPPMKVVCSIQH